MQQFTQVTINVTSVEESQHQPFEKTIKESLDGNNLANSTKAKRSSSRSSSRHSWVHGGSPRSGGRRSHAGNSCSSSKAKTTKSEASNNFHQFLALPKPVQQDPYTTPKHKEVCLADVSNTERSERMLKALQAPKKRDEMYDEFNSSRNHSRAAHDYENMSIRAFRLESSSSKGDGSSTAGDSSRGQQQAAALEEMRTQWHAFTENIMNVQIAPAHNDGAQSARLPGMVESSTVSLGALRI